MISEAAIQGTIQVPADGNPIILMSDRQSVAGYPKIAQVSNGGYEPSGTMQAR